MTNQQERPGIEQWAVGFVDGEGCFSISVVRNRVCPLGRPAGSSTSSASRRAAPSRAALEVLIGVFGCGLIIENHRTDNHVQPLLRFSVKRRSDLVAKVVPFFEERPLVTAKQLDFEKFAGVLRLMEEGQHLTEAGLRPRRAPCPGDECEQMNRRQRSRYLESSEAIRHPTQTDSELKIWS